MSAKEKFIITYNAWIAAKRDVYWTWDSIESAWAEYCIARDVYFGLTRDYPLYQAVA